MYRSVNIPHYVYTILCILVIAVNGYGQDLLDLPVKDLDGEIKPLRERIDPSTNYIIEAMAFWCAPCRRSMDDFAYHQSYWKERFNTEIILLEDEHFNDLDFVKDALETGNWDLNTFVSNEKFQDFGINSYPTYFFIEAQSDSIYEIPTGNERFLLATVDSIHFNSIFEQDFQQSYIVNECDNVSTDYYQLSDTPLQVGEYSYQIFGDLLLRERALNGDLMILDPITNEERVYIKYSAPLCTQQILKDTDGDYLEFKVLEKYQIGGVLHILTDRKIFDECTDDEKPLILIQGIGTNAGLNFDIEENQVISRLVCHQRSEEIIYQDEELVDLCLPVYIENHNPRLEISIMPNPVVNDFQILMSISGNKIIELYSINGKLLLSTQTSNDQIVISNIEHITQESILLCKVITTQGAIINKVFITSK